MDFEKYREWSRSQPCVDCGKIKEGEEMWVTEIQCLACFEKHGSTENRGKSASGIASENGVYAE